MSSVALCHGKAKYGTGWDNNQVPDVGWREAQDGVLPTGMKRRRLTCSECGRRVMSSVRTCGDGCCLYHYLPPHKPKGWWKRKKVARKTKGRRKSVRRES